MELPPWLSSALTTIHHPPPIPPPTAYHPPPIAQLYWSEWWERINGGSGAAPPGGFRVLIRKVGFEEHWTGFDGSAPSVPWGALIVDGVKSEGDRLLICTDEMDMHRGGTWQFQVHGLTAGGENAATQVVPQGNKSQILTVRTIDAHVENLNAKVNLEEATVEAWWDYHGPVTAEHPVKFSLLVREKPAAGNTHADAQAAEWSGQNCGGVVPTAKEPFKIGARGFIQPGKVYQVCVRYEVAGSDLETPLRSVLSSPGADLPF